MTEIQDKNQFISLAEASELTGYNQDYLGQLCRLGKLAGQKIGRNWTTTKTALEDLQLILKTEADKVSPLSIGKRIPVHVEARPIPDGSNSGKVSVTVQREVADAVVGLPIILKEKAGTQAGSSNLSEIKSRVQHLHLSSKVSSLEDRLKSGEDFKSSKSKFNNRAKSLVLAAIASLAFAGMSFGYGTQFLSDFFSKPDQLAITMKSPGFNHGNEAEDVLGITTLLPVILQNRSLVAKLDEDYIERLILNNLNNAISAGWIAKPGDLQSGTNSGAALPTGNSGQSYAPIYYVQPSTPNFPSGVSLLSATDLSSQRFVSTTATITNLTVTGTCTGCGDPLAIGTAVASATAGSVLFADASGNLGQDNTNFYFDDSANALGIGSNSISASAILQLSSTTKGFLAPRMTTAERDLIASPATGLTVYNTSTSKYNYYDGGAWVAVASGVINTALSGITAATSDATANHGANNVVWNWQLTGAETAFTFGESTASSGGLSDQYILQATTLASSTAIPLFVNNLGSGNSFLVADSASDTTPFVINAAGNVGIGTTSPGALLTVQNDNIGSTSTDGILLQNTTAATLGQQQWSPRIHLVGQGWRSNPTAASNTIDWIIENQTASGDNSGIGSLAFSYQQSNTPGYSNFFKLTPGVNSSGVTLTIGVTGTASIDISSTNHSIQSYEGSALFLNPAGNNVVINGSNSSLSIGTLSPAGALHVASAVTRQALFNRTEIGSTLTDGTYFGAGGSGEFSIINQEANSLIFGTNNTERLRIDSSGNVGVGTTIPLSVGTNYGTLDVRGSAGGGVRFGTDGGGHGILYGNGTDGAILETSTTIPIKFNPNGSTAMTIISGGNVGIGSATPGARLDIVPAANSIAFQSTGYSLTGSNAQSLVDLSGTLNTTGSPSVFKLNITNTASGSDTRLIDLQTAGVSRLTMGASTDPSFLVGRPAFTAPFSTTYLNSGMVAAGVNGFWVTNNALLTEELALGGLYLNSADSILFHNGTNLLTGADDTSIARASANNISIKNASSTTYWTLGSVGIQAGTDNIYDIGAVAATRPRTGYFGTSVVTPTLSASTSLTTPALYISGTASTDFLLRKGTVSNLLLRTGDDSGFGGLGMGGFATSSDARFGGLQTDGSLGTTVIMARANNSAQGVLAVYGSGGNPQINFTATANAENGWDVFLTRASAANLQLGDVSAASPVAQTLSVQSVASGNSNVAGANFTIAGSQSTGSATGGSILFQTSPAGGGGSSVNALVTAMAILGSGNVGIGTTIPLTALHVGAAGAITVDNLGSFAGRDAGGNARAMLFTDASDIVNLQNNTGANGGPIRLNSLTGGGETMRLDTTGNVSIGTTAVTKKLTIADGVLLQDFGANSTPATLGGIDFGTYVDNVTVSGKYMYVSIGPVVGTGCSASDASGCEFRIYDISTPSATPTFLGGVNTTLDADTHAIAVSGKYVFLGTSNNGSGNELLVIDISDPSTPSIVGGVEFGTPVNALFVSGKYLYVGNTAIAGTCSTADATGCEFRIYDIIHPTTPAFVNGTDYTVRVNSIFVQGKYAYLAASTKTGNDFMVINVSNPVSLSEIGGADLSIGARTVKVSGSYAYVGNETIAGTGCSSGDASGCEFRIYRISNPASPTFVGGLNLAASVLNARILGKYAYIGGFVISGNEFQIIDISTPSAPTLVGGIDMSNSAVAFDVKGKYAYVGWGTNLSGNDLRMYDLSGIDTPAANIGAIATDNIEISDNLQVSNTAYIGNSLNVGVGGILSGGPISIQSASTSSSLYAFDVKNSAGTSLFTIRDDGVATLGRLSTTATANSIPLDLQVNKSDNTAGKIRLQAVYNASVFDRSILRVSSDTYTLADFYTQESGATQSRFDLYDASAGAVGLRISMNDAGSGATAITSIASLFRLGANNVAGNVLATTLSGTGVMRINALMDIQDGVLAVRNHTATATNAFIIKNYSANNVYQLTYEAASTTSTVKETFLDNSGVTKVQISPTTDSYFNGGNVGIGTTTISARLHTLATTEQLRVGYDASNYYSTTVSSAGAVTYDAVGSSAGFIFSDTISVPGAGANSQRFGPSTLAAGDSAIAIGLSASAATDYAISIGRNTANGTGFGGVAIGYAANTAGSAVAIGYNAVASATGTAVGYSSSALGSAFGNTAVASGTSSLALGGSAIASASESIAIGTNSSSTHTSSIAVGAGAASTATNQFILGGQFQTISDLYFGCGVTKTSTCAATLQATGGSGTDNAASNLLLAGGKATGNAAGGDILFQTSDAGASGATLQSLTTKMIITESGTVGIGTTTVGALLHLAVDNATTNDVTDLQILQHTTTGTPAAGIGTGMLFRTEDGSGNLTDITRINNTLSTVTNGSEQADFEVKLLNAPLAGSTFLSGLKIGGTTYGVSLGLSASANGSAGQTGVAIGRQASANHNSAIAISYNASAAGEYGIAIGQGASIPSTASASIALGLSAVIGASSVDSFAIGQSSSATGTASIAIGGFTTATASNQLVIGGASGRNIANAYIGNGVTAASPSAFTLNATGGSGTDIAGANILFAGGKGTGNAAGGDILFQTSDAGSSGATLQSLTTKMTILASGNVGIGTSTISAKLHSLATTEQLRLGYDASNYISFTVSSTGSLALSPNGNAALTLIPTASAVNGLSLTNAATGGTVSLRPTGSDASISYNIAPKGTGSVLTLWDDGATTVFMNRSNPGGDQRLRLDYASNNIFEITPWWAFDQSSFFGPTLDNQRDLGRSSERVRSGYFGTSVVTPTLSATTSLITPLLYGGIAANDDITIEGTSHATKTSSYVILQPTSGNVGIGTTNPVAKLDVAGNVVIRAASKYYFNITGAPAIDTNWALGYEVNPTGAQINTEAGVVQTIYGGGANYGYLVRNTSNTSLFEIQGSDGKAYFAGNVGIGTTSPSYPLQVVKTDTSGTSVVDVFNVVHNATSGLGNGVGTGILIKTRDSAGDYEDTVRLSGTLTNASSASEASSFSISTRTGGGALVVQTTIDATGNLTQTGTITVQGSSDSSISGDLGIGTTNAQAKLHIQAGGALVPSLGNANAIIVNSAGAASNTGLSLISGNTGTASLYFGDYDANGQGEFRYDNSTNNLTYYDSTATARMVWATGGNIGIGTTIPLELLHALGNARIGQAPTSLTLINDGDGITAGDTTITVDSTTSYPSAGTLLIDSEAMTYTGKTATTFTGVTRGALGTTAATHADDATINNYLLTTIAQSTTTPKLLVTGSGNVGIGDASPDTKLDVEGDSASAYIATFFNDGNDQNRYGIEIQGGADDASGTTYYLNALDGDGGQVGYIANTSGTFALTDVSDVRTKTNIQDTQIDAMEILMGLHVVDFNRLQDSDGPKITGFIAQEVQQVYPKIITTGANGYLGITKENLIPVLVKGFQDQQSQITALQLSLNALQGNPEGNIDPSTAIVIKAHLYLSKDSIGQAKILAGQTSVRINFEKPYEYQPIVTATANGKVGSEYWVSDKDSTGFTLYIENASQTDVTFDWHAFAAEEAKLTVSNGTQEDIVLVVPVAEDPEPVVSNQEPEPTGFEEGDLNEGSLETPKPVQGGPEVPEGTIIESDPLAGA